MWCPRGQNWACRGGHKLKHRKKERKFQNSSMKLEGLELWYLVYSISLRTSTKFVHKLKHRNKEAYLQNFSSLKLDGIEIWYVASPCGPLPSLFIKCSWVKTIPTPGARKLNIGTKNVNFLVILYVASPCGPLPSLFIRCPLGQDWFCHGVHKLEHRNKNRQISEFFFSESGRPTALIFCM